MAYLLPRLDHGRDSGPDGFRKGRPGVYHGHQNGRGLVANDAEQAAIVAMQAMRARGWTLEAIADEELNELGVPTKTGRHWTHQVVGKILKRCGPALVNRKRDKGRVTGDSGVMSAVAEIVLHRVRRDWFRLD